MFNPPKLENLKDNMSRINYHTSLISWMTTHEWFFITAL